MAAWRFEATTETNGGGGERTEEVTMGVADGQVDLISCSS
jgi:hypothetical protein